MSNKSIRASFCSGLYVILSSTFCEAQKVTTPELSARDIMVKNDDARKVQSVQSKATISSTGGGSKDHTKSFTWWRKLTDDGSRFNTLTKFQSPAEVKGEGILFLELPGGSADVQLYLPNFKKIRRVEESQQSGSFMGSEFSYTDIAAPHVDDFNYKLLKNEKCPLPGDQTQMCFVVESTPKTDEVKNRTGASRGLSWIRPDNFMAVRGEYFDQEGKPWKHMEAKNIKEVDLKLHKWMAMDVSMENSKSNRHTALHFEDVQANQKMQLSLFTAQNLARGL